MPNSFENYTTISVEVIVTEENCRLETFDWKVLKCLPLSKKKLIAVITKQWKNFNGKIT